MFTVLPAGFHLWSPGSMVPDQEGDVVTQTVLAGPASPAGSRAFAPVERVRLQQRLHEVWRSTVMCLTDLAVRFHAAERDVQVGDITAAGTRLVDSRLQLAEIEAAMRRMDEGHFGSCESCGGAM